MKPLTTEQVEKLKFGDTYVRIELVQVGQSQGYRSDWPKKVYFVQTSPGDEVRDLLERLDEIV